jgi:hypothetical protein
MGVLRVARRSGSQPAAARLLVARRPARWRWRDHAVRVASGDIWWLIGTARPPVAYLRLMLAHSTTLKVPVTVVSGHRFFATRIGARVIRWGAFNAAGRELYGGSGPPDAIGKRRS